MTSKRTFALTILAFGALLIGFGTTSHAQGGDKFKGRLSPMPVIPAPGTPRPSVAGVGMATATLSGRKLSITGTFENMASPATVARLHTSSMTGMRGDPVFDLTVEKTGTGTTGTIAGTFDLTPAQVDAVKKGRFYVQIHSEGAPNGHLFGWLLK